MRPFSCTHRHMWIKEGFCWMHVVLTSHDVSWHKSGENRKILEGKLECAWIKKCWKARKIKEQNEKHLWDALNLPHSTIYDLLSITVWGCAIRACYEPLWWLWSLLIPKDYFTISQELKRHGTEGYIWNSGSATKWRTSWSLGLESMARGQLWHTQMRLRSWNDNSVILTILLTYVAFCYYTDLNIAQSSCVLCICITV